MGGGHDAEVAVTVYGSGASHGDSRNLCPVDQGRKWPDAALRRLPESSCDPVGTGSQIGVGVRGAAAPGADAVAGVPPPPSVRRLAPSPHRYCAKALFAPAMRFVSPPFLHSPPRFSHASTSSAASLRGTLV